MPRIPNSWFNGPIRVEKPLPPGPLGERFEAPQTIRRAYTEDRVRMVRSGTGEIVPSASQVVVDPGQLIPVNTKVTIWLGETRQRTAKVVAVALARRPGLMSHQLLYLE